METGELREITRVADAEAARTPEADHGLIRTRLASPQGCLLSG